MKQKFTFKTILTLLGSVGIISSVQAQDAFSVNWSLATDSLATVTGNAVASPQVVSAFLTNKRYGRMFDANSNTGWQGKGEGQAWTAGFDNTIYDEYKIKPALGYSLTINAFQLSALGGGTSGMRLAVYYSKNGFVTFDSLSTGSASGGSGATYNSSTYRATPTDPIVLLNTSTTALAGREIVNFPGLNITINAGDSLIIRTYPFLTAAGNRYYPSKQVFINGTSAGSVVPVSFANAKAFQENGGVQVEWISATEVNVSRYAIEKSTDGRTFREAGTVAATGNGTAAKTYSWFDATPAQGANYYRVKALDKDGSSKYTGILKVNLGKGAAGIVISPNPVKSGVINLQLNNLDRGTYIVQLLNSAGQKVFGGQIVHQGGSASESLQIPTLQKGLYNLQLVNGVTRITKSVIIE